MEIDWLDAGLFYMLVLCSVVGCDSHVLTIGSSDDDQCWCVHVKSLRYHVALNIHMSGSF